MLVLKNEGRRRKKNRYMKARVRARPCHYRHGPCQLTGVFWFWQGMGWHGRATAGTGRAKFLAFQAQKVVFLRPLESVSDNNLQNNLKQTKSN